MIWLLLKLASYGSEEAKNKKHSYSQLLKAKLSIAKKHRLTSVLIAKGSPYLLSDYNDLVDIILLNFDDRIYSLANVTEGGSEKLTQTKQGETMLNSPGFNAAMAVVFSSKPELGLLPVSLKVK